jgi:hypothetical protein
LYLRFWSWSRPTSRLRMSLSTYAERAQPKGAGVVVLHIALDALSGAAAASHHVVAGALSR